MKHFTASAIFLAVVAAASAAWSQNVKVTPLGSHAGELCVRDRATIFEDPSGVRIFYDAGQSVTGADDPRLGKIDVVILSHAHGDHIGDLKLKALESGTCATPEVVSAAPNSTTGMSQEIVMGTTRFSPGCKVKRTAIAAANGSPLLIHVRLSLAKRPSFEKEFHTWSPASGENVV